MTIVTSSPVSRLGAKEGESARWIGHWPWAQAAPNQRSFSRQDNSTSNPGTVCWRRKPNHARPVRHGYRRLKLPSLVRAAPPDSWCSPFQRHAKSFGAVLAQKYVGLHVVFPSCAHGVCPSYFQAAFETAMPVFL